MKRFIICLILVLVSSCYSYEVRDEDKMSQLDSIDISLFHYEYTDRTEIKSKISLDNFKKSLNNDGISVDSLFWSEWVLRDIIESSFEELLKTCEYPQTLTPKNFKLKILDTLYYTDPDNHCFEIYPYETFVSGNVKNKFGESYEVCLKVDEDFILNKYNLYYRYRDMLQHNNKTLFLVKHHYFPSSYPKWWTNIRFSISNKSVLYSEPMKEHRDFRPGVFRYFPFTYNNREYYLVVDQDLYEE